MGQMEGKNVFLTGASKGMGREMARGLAKEGATLALVARTESALQELAEELNGLGGRGVAIPTDVSDRD
jgi:3-oxoacyl-[acyl-carrier protein] reductase